MAAFRLLDISLQAVVISLLPEPRYCLYSAIRADTRLYQPSNGIHRITSFTDKFSHKKRQETYQFPAVFLSVFYRNTLSIFFFMERNRRLIVASDMGIPISFSLSPIAMMVVSFTRKLNTAIS
jgi:hypothetical protein